MFPQHLISENYFSCHNMKLVYVHTETYRIRSLVLRCLAQILKNLLGFRKIIFAYLKKKKKAKHLAYNSVFVSFSLIFFFKEVKRTSKAGDK